MAVLSSSREDFLNIPQPHVAAILRWDTGQIPLRKRRGDCFYCSPGSKSLRIGTFGPAFESPPRRLFPPLLSFVAYHARRLGLSSYLSPLFGGLKLHRSAFASLY